MKRLAREVQLQREGREGTEAQPLALLDVESAFDYMKSRANQILCPHFHILTAEAI